MGAFRAGNAVAGSDGLLESWARTNRIARLVAWLVTSLLAAAVGFRSARGGVTARFGAGGVALGSGAGSLIRSRTIGCLVLLALAGAMLLGAVPARADIFWASTTRTSAGNSGSAIGHASDDGTNVNSSFIVPSSDAFHNLTALAVGGGYVYWALTLNGNIGSPSAIGRAKIDGSAVTPNLITGPRSVSGLAVDGSHIYWSDNQNNGSANIPSIGRANLDGTGVNENFITPPAGTTLVDRVAVDPSHIYWENQPLSGTASIAEANLDASGINPSLVPNVASGSLALDSSHLYFNTFPMPFTHFVGNRANLDGTGATSILTDGDHLAAGGGYVFYDNGRSDGVFGNIGRVNADGTAPNPTFIPGGASPNNGPLDIAVSPATCSITSSARATARDSLTPRIARATEAGAGCGSITLTPNTVLQVGDVVTIQGVDWNPTKGPVYLQLVNPGTGVPTRTLPTGTVDGSGRFTTKFKLTDFTKRGIYPRLSDGCAVGVRAAQGAQIVIAQGTSPALGHVAYAHYGGGSAPFKTGEVYCAGEDPAGKAGLKDIVVTVPAGSPSPVPGLTAYRVGADPLNINFRGDRDNGSLFVGGTLCLSRGPRSQSVVISGASPVAHVGTCPAVFPARHDNQGVRRFGIGRSGSVGNGCLDLAAKAGMTGTKVPVGPLAFAGDLDCKLGEAVGSLLSVARTVFVDGSLRVRSPFVNVFGSDLITSGSFDASVGISTTGLSRAIVGGDATFGIGPPDRGMSKAQKDELNNLSHLYSLSGEGATYAGGVIGMFTVTPKTPVSVGYVAATFGAMSVADSLLTRYVAALAADPPDRAYRIVARPAAVSGFPTTVRAGHGLSKAKARVLSALLKAMSRETAVGLALETAVNRAGGASQAGNTTAERKQIAAAVKYALSEAKLLDSQPRLLASAARVLRSLPAGRVRPTLHSFTAFRKALRAHGFSARYAAAQRRAGITAQELKLERLVLLAIPDPRRLSAAQVVGDPALASADRKLAKLLRAFANAAPTTVGRRR